MSNITEVFCSEVNLGIMSKGIIASSLDEVLNGDGPYTVFAPSDLAFGRLSREKMESLLLPENKKELSDLLSRHIIRGKIQFKDLKDGDKLKTLNEKELNVKVRNWMVSIEGSYIQDRDILSSNGVIHSLDKVVNN